MTFLGRSVAVRRAWDRMFGLSICYGTMEMDIVLRHLPNRLFTSEAELMMHPGCLWGIGCEIAIHIDHTIPFMSTCKRSAMC
jgi:hypothetical protein